METCYTDNGSYAPCDDLAVLAGIEPTLTGEPITFPVAATATGYSLSVASDTAGQTFGIVNTAGV